MSEVSTIAIPKDVLEPIIKAKVAAAVIEAMGDKSTILDKAVAAVFNTKVDDSGAVLTYNKEYGKTWLDWAIGQAIKDATRAALSTGIEQFKAVIQDRIVADLKKKNSPIIQDFVASCFGSMARGIQSKYNVKVEVGKDSY